MAFIRWTELSTLVSTQRPVSRMAETLSTGWTPPMDVYETGDRFVVLAEFPGLAREDIEISVRDGRLTVLGRRPKPAYHAEQYHQIETGYGTVSRTFSFPQAVETGRIQADMREGVLAITIPKATRSGARRVEVT